MKNRKLLITALSLILCLTVSIGLAVAYFTDYEAAKGGAVLQLNGQTEIEEKADDTSKTVTIVNTGDADMVTRVMFIGDPSKLTVTPGENWSGPDDDGWYYYTKVLKKAGSPNNTKTKPISGTISVKGDDDIKDFDIIVVHESERVLYDGDTVAIPEGWAVSSIAAE